MNTKPLLSWQTMTLNLRNPFGLSYGVSTTRNSFWIRLRDDCGWGEGAIPYYYGISDESMIAYWDRMALRTDPLPETVEEIEGWMDMDGPAPARCAVEMALYDQAARMAGKPLYQLLGLPQSKGVLTSFTISISTPEEMAELALGAKDIKVIKIKMGGDNDEANLRAVRAARPDARLMIDANSGWSREQSLGMLPCLEENGVELVEQPVVKDDLEGMSIVQKHTHLPVVADESLQSVADLEKIAALGIRGVNLKLMKLGGISTAVKILKRSHELGLRIMLGQMIETSLGTTAMAHLSGLADWVDLDGPLLIANNPFTGIAYKEDGELIVPEAPGIGVTERKLK